MNRKETRKGLARLYRLYISSLVGAEFIHDGRPADFYGELKAICVYSSGTTWKTLSRAESHRPFTVSVDIFIKYADEELHWTEANAEDLLDDISDATLDFVDANQVHDLYWKALSVNEMTQTGDTVDVNGTEYRRETIIITIT